MTRLLNVQFAGVHLLTGLPEYRNGGLLIDTGLVTLKPADTKRGLDAYRNNALVKGQPCMEVVPLFSTDDDVVVEWRALTIGFLDDLHVEVNRLLKLDGPDKLSLAQMLEAGSWKVSREHHPPSEGRWLMVQREVASSPKCRDQIRSSHLS